MDATLKAYCTRWQAVAEVERQELQTATLELRWQQLNAVICMAIGLGIFQPTEDEIEIFQRWAKLKEKAASQRPSV
jgi:hypothetical protein